MSSVWLYQHFGQIWFSEFVHFGHPLTEVCEGLLVGDVVHDDDAVSVAVTGRQHRTVALLAAGVPYLLCKVKALIGDITSPSPTLTGQDDLVWIQLIFLQNNLLISKNGTQEHNKQIITYF